MSYIKMYQGTDAQEAYILHSIMSHQESDSPDIIILGLPFTQHFVTTDSMVFVWQFLVVPLSPI